MAERSGFNSQKNKNNTLQTLLGLHSIHSEFKSWWLVNVTPADMFILDLASFTGQKTVFTRSAIIFIFF